jgi:ribosomal protein L16 Arg81 hydroxylase
MDVRWKPIALLCSRLQNALQHPVGANLYVSPPNSQGLLPHFDDHDVFVLQVEGTKIWQLYGSPMPLPLHKMKAPLQSSPGSSREELTVKAGDLLYIPRGFIHSAITTECRSVHLTVGVRVFTWFNLLANILKEQAEQNVALREALPVGSLRSDDTKLTSIARGLLADIAAVADSSSCVERFNSTLRHRQRRVRREILRPDRAAE